MQWDAIGPIGHKHIIQYGSQLGLSTWSNMQQCQHMDMPIWCIKEGTKMALEFTRVATVKSQFNEELRGNC